MFKVSELKPVASKNKSYYGKALIIDDESKIMLKSYETIVCFIQNGKFYRSWNGYSATTMKHINDFCLYNGLETMNKKTWLEMPVYNYIKNYK